MAGVLVGTCSWTHLRGLYPAGLAQGERLAFYARHFPVVEVDSTFYQLPRPSAVERWAAQTPAGFRFDVKAPRTITHLRRPDDVGPFDEALRPLREAGKLGALVLTLPPWFRLSGQNRAFLAAARQRFPRDRIAVELAHASWLAEEHAARTFDFLGGLGLVYVASVDSPPAATSVDLALARVRAADDLSAWVGRLAALGEGAAEVHALVKGGAESVEPARSLMAALGQEAPAAPTQLGLPLG